MSLLNILLISVALGVDSFSVGMLAGACFQKIFFKQKIKMTLYFGVSHIIMPTIGWFVGAGIADLIDQLDHWVILILLLFVGIKLIYESIKNNNHEEIQMDFFSRKNLLILSLATSIDALAIGISFALLQQAIIYPAVVIGAIVSCMTWISISLGRKIKKSTPQKMQLIAGIILILIGIRIFLEHQGVIKSFFF